MIYKFCPDCGGKCERKNAKTYQCQICLKMWFDQPRVSVDCIVVNQRNELLFTVRAKNPKKGTYTVPGGFVDHNENALQTVIRETLEETGATISDIKYFNTYPVMYTYQSNEYPVLSITFLAKFVKFTKRFDKEETQDLVWIKADSVNLKKIGLENVKNAIRDYLESIGATHR